MHGLEYKGSSSLHSSDFFFFRLTAPLTLPAFSRQALGSSCFLGSKGLRWVQASSGTPTVWGSFSLPFLFRSLAKPRKRCRNQRCQATAPREERALAWPRSSEELESGWAVPGGGVERTNPFLSASFEANEKKQSCSNT